MVFVWAQMLDFSYVFVNLLAKFSSCSWKWALSHAGASSKQMPDRSMEGSGKGGGFGRQTFLQWFWIFGDFSTMAILAEIVLLWDMHMFLMCFKKGPGLQQCPSKPPFFQQVMCWSSLRRSLKLVSKEVISMGQIKWTYKVTHILSFLGFRGLCPGPHHQVRKLEPLWYWNLDPKVCHHDQHSSLCHQDQKCEVAQISSMSRGEFS